MENVGANIRKYREMMGLSQKRLGLLLGLSDKAISAYESDRTLPPVETLYRIARQLDIPIYLLINDDNNEHQIIEKMNDIEITIKKLIKEVEALKETTKQFKN